MKFKVRSFPLTDRESVRVQVAEVKTLDETHVVFKVDPSCALKDNLRSQFENFATLWDVEMRMRQDPAARRARTRYYFQRDGWQRGDVAFANELAEVVMSEGDGGYRNGKFVPVSAVGDERRLF